MALVNHGQQEINAKIVYFGPERVGKGLSLRYVYDRIRPHLRGELKTVPAGGASLLFFDFCPFEQPILGGYRIRFHLYTLLGRVDNPAAWKMTLKGADGLVIVADASPAGIPASRRSLALLREILGSYGVGLDDIPNVLQPVRDASDAAAAVDSLRRELGIGEGRTCPASVRSGEGVLEALTLLSRAVLGRIAERADLPGMQPATAAQASADAPPPVPDEGMGGTAGEAVFHPLPTSGGTSGRLVSVADEGVRVEGDDVVIPLEFSLANGERQRLTLTLQFTAGQERSAPESRP